jgi:hypothetical protein
MKEELAMFRTYLLVFPALFVVPSLLLAQDTAASRSQADIAREADSVRHAYADSIAHSEPTATAQPAPPSSAAPAPATRPPPAAAGQPSRDQVERAISRGQKGKDFEGIDGGSKTFMKQGRGYDVELTGPLNRVTNAARAARKKYLPYTPDSVSAAELKPVVVVTAYPRKPQLMSGSWKQTPPASHLVLRSKGDHAAVVQPTSVATFPESWGNAFGAKFEGQGVRGEFPLPSVPAGDFDVVVITSDGEYTIGVKGKDRSRLQ